MTFLQALVDMFFLRLPSDPPASVILSSVLHCPSRRGRVHPQGIVQGQSLSFSYCLELELISQLD